MAAVVDGLNMRIVSTAHSRLNLYTYNLYLLQLILLINPKLFIRTRIIVVRLFCSRRMPGGKAAECQANRRIRREQNNLTTISRMNK